MSSPVQPTAGSSESATIEEIHSDSDDAQSGDEASGALTSGAIAEGGVAASGKKKKKKKSKAKKLVDKVKCVEAALPFLEHGVDVVACPSLLSFSCSTFTS